MTSNSLLRPETLRVREYIEGDAVACLDRTFGEAAKIAHQIEHCSAPVEYYAYYWIDQVEVYPVFVDGYVVGFSTTDPWEPPEHSDLGDDEIVCVWADGTWCYLYELEGMLSFMSDDFSQIPAAEWPEANEDLADLVAPAGNIAFTRHNAEQ